MTATKDIAVAVDTGGTFTDVIVAKIGGEVLAGVKEPTDPVDPSASVIRGIEKALAQAKRTSTNIARLVHGTTIATNLVLEGKGAPVAFVGSDKFEQIPLIGREARGGTSVFDLKFEKPFSLVESGAMYGVSGRLDFRGSEVAPFDKASADRCVRKILERGITSVAVCFLHAYANGSHERAFRDALLLAIPHCYVALSSEIWPEFREYDRAMTTIVSAYVGPGLAIYLTHLETSLKKIGVSAGLEVMRSDGGVGTARTILKRAVSVLESGPAAGVLAAGRVGQLTQNKNLISFDMGGTTAKAGVVIDGTPVITRAFTVGGAASSTHAFDGRGIPVRGAVIDLAEVGAGGGSIAIVDAWGMLKVGPESAGALPGPACYGKGGDRPTITDANLVLGYLTPGAQLGGDIVLSRERAENALRAHVAEPLGMTVIEAAQGIFEIATASMLSAIRMVTIGKGIDPRQCTLVGFGGAGPCHVIRLGEELGIRRVIAPRYAGIMSSLGLISADASSEIVMTRTELLERIDVQSLLDSFEGMIAKVSEVVLEQNVGQGLVVTRSADLRYFHQAHELTITLPDDVTDNHLISELDAMFRRGYEQRFGIRSPDPVEIVNLRVQVLCKMPKLGNQQVAAPPYPPSRRSERTVQFYQTCVERTPVYWSGDLGYCSLVKGPAIIEDPYSSLVVPRGWDVQCDQSGNLVAENVSLGLS